MRTVSRHLAVINIDHLIRSARGFSEENSLDVVKLVNIQSSKEPLDQGVELPLTTAPPAKGQK